MPSDKKSKQLTRRQLLGSTIAATGALAAGGAVLPEHGPRLNAAVPSALEGDTRVILFQGDSITDAGRNRRQAGPNNASAMGRGYPFLIGSWLLATRNDPNLKIYNRGISGHKVPDLQKRWQKDTIDLKPDVLSILIGVNDIWHKLAGRYDGTAADYEKGFNELIEQTSKALPETQIVICEPFVLRCGAVNDKWFPEFDKRRAAARRVAEKAEATWVPFQETFDSAVNDAPANYWAGDGVHPSMAGHMKMTMAWLKALRDG